MAIKELFYDQRPVALLNPRASQRIDPRFKFTRASTGTYVDSSGVIRTAQQNQPRFNYDPTTKERLGFLHEPSATNIANNSTTFDWPTTNATRTNNYAIAPDGTQTASRIQTAAVIDVGKSMNLRSDNTPLSAGVHYVISFFVKLISGTGSATRVIFGFADASGTPSYASYGLKLSDETEASDGSLPAYRGFQKYPNDWYRIYGEFTPSVTSITSFSLRFGTPASSATAEFYVWGVQIEASDFLTAYIPVPNFGISRTRASDLLSVDSLSIPSTGSVYIDARAIGAGETDTLISLKNASNQKINLSYESNAATYNSLALIASYSGTSKSSLPLPVPTTARERSIITWGANNYQYTTDSSRYATSLSSSVPANLTQLSIGHDAVDTTKAFNGYINAVYLYNGEITPAVAEALVRGELDPINADTYSPVGPTGSLALIINTQGASASGNKTFTLPAESALNDNDIVITWGDGTESGLDGASAELGAPGLTHTYPAAGIYPVWVEGQLENLQFNNIANAPDLVQIATWGTSANGNDVFRSPSTMNSAFYGCSQMNFSTSARTTNLPDTSAVTNWFRAFRGCSSITGTFPAFNLSAATTLQEAWHGCSGMTSFIAAGDQTQNVINFYGAWAFCYGLTSFPLINTAAGTDFSSAWENCSSLTSFPLINTASGTNFTSAWRGCTGLTSFPLINTAAGTNFYFAWAACSSLTSFPLINTAAGISFAAAWYNCSSLTSFPLINTAAGTNFSSAWYNCNSLTSFPLINTAAGTDFSLAWYTCSSLTAFPALSFGSATGSASDASNTYTGFRETWRNCYSLTDFPANRFNTTTCTRYLDAWTGCALTAQSIENILVSINTANTSNGNLSLNGGTNAAKTTWSTAANTAYNALVARGWTITFNA